MQPFAGRSRLVFDGGRWLPGSAAIGRTKGKELAVAALALLAADGGNAYEAVACRHTRPATHAQRHGVDDGQIDERAKSFSAVTGAAIANLIADAEDDVDPPCPIDPHLRLLRMLPE